MTKTWLEVGRVGTNMPFGAGILLQEETTEKKKIDGRDVEVCLDRML
jgi:hypothetical protein